MSTYLKRASALTAIVLLALALGIGLTGMQKAYAEGGGGLVAGSTLQAQADYKSDVAAAPLVNVDPGGAQTAVDPEDLEISAFYSYTSSTKKDRLNDDGTPKDVTVLVSASNLQKFRNDKGETAYRIGLGIPAAEGNQYAFGFGACPETPAFNADSKDGQFAKDETTYDSFYFATESSFAGKTAYIAVKNAGGYVTVYHVDLTDVYTDTELARGLYKVTGLATDTGMINVDNDDATTYIKVENGQAKLLVRIYGANKYDYLFAGGVDTRPDAAETDKMTAGVPVPADANYIANGAQKSQVFTDEAGVLGAAGMKYKAMYYELPITQADIAAKKVTVSIRRAPWSPSKPSQWMGDTDHSLTFTGYEKAGASDDLVDGDIYEKYTVAAVTATNKIPFEPTADDLQVYSDAYTAYGELDYSQSDIGRAYLDCMIPEIAAKLEAADKAIPNIVPEDGTYTFLQTLKSYNYPSIAEGLYSDSLYSGVLTVKDGKMTVTVSQRRGSYSWLYLGFPTDALAAEKKAGAAKDIPGIVDFKVENTVWLDHAAGTIGPDGNHDKDTAGEYQMYTGTFELKSLEKPIMISWRGSSWYNRSFIFHKANLVPANTAPAIRQIRALLNSPDQDDPDVTKPLYRVDPAKVTTENAAAINAAKAAYDALSDADKAVVDSLIVEYGTQSYGRVLENAVWGLEAASALNNSTNFADGNYLDRFVVSSSKGKSTSDKERTWSLTDITVKNGKATGTLVSDQSSTFSSVIVNGTTYKNIAAAGEKSKFEIPLALGSTMSFVAVSNTAVKGGIAYQLTLKEKAANGMTVTAKNPAALTFKKAAQTIACPLTVKNATGKVTYSKVSGSKYFKVNATTGKITVAKSTPAGKYTIKMEAAAAGSDTVLSASSTKSVTIKVNKAKNTFAAKPAIKSGKITIKAGKSVAASKAFKITKNVSGGTVTYAKTKGNAKITVSKAGKISVKKGLKAKSYPITVKLTSKATKNYKAASDTVKLTIVVK